MVFMTPDLFSEIHGFLTIHLAEENLSFACRSKLLKLISKLEFYNASENYLCEDEYLYEEPCRLIPINIDTHFELPSKCMKDKNDRQNVTLSGSLYYRYNFQCWENYPSSILIDGRLICSKIAPTISTGPVNENFNSPNSGKNTELSIFLMGYSAIMTGKDCGMNFVFKLTHPSEETKVFSTETSKEALAWIEQINQYSLGFTPTDIQIFHDNGDFKQLSDDADAITQVLSGSQCSLVDEDIKKYENAHLRRQSSDLLSVMKNSTIPNANCLISEAKFNRSRSSYSFKNGGRTINNNLSGSIISGSGTSIISSMRRKVENFGNKCRNRKSFAGFTTKTLHSNASIVGKSKTMTELTNGDNRRASMFCPQFLPKSKYTIYQGMAKLRVHGNRAGWMERWCQLKPKLLECYHISSNGLKPTLDFALCLEDLTLGVSNDKKHRSAIRLSCDKVKQDLLFEVQEKVLLGDWIKAFIEALEINNPKKKTTDQNGVSDNHSYKDIEIEEDIMQRSLTTIRSYGSESIYDEVCASDYKQADLSSVITRSPQLNHNSQRRWSSPNLELPQRLLRGNNGSQSGRRCIRDHPLPSLPDSETNSDTLSDTPTGNTECDIESIYDYATTTRKDHITTCTNTLKSDIDNTIYSIDEANIHASIPYADQENDYINGNTNSNNVTLEFSNNKDHWRRQGYSLADLIARFEPQSSSQENSSATMSSKTDSSCTPTHQNSSEYNINSICTSFISVQSIDRSENNNSVRGVSRSVSADMNLGILRPSIEGVTRKERPHSLVMKKTSLELVFEELTNIKEDLRTLKKQRKELQRALSQKTCNETQSIESLNSIISDVSHEILNKESRLKELSNHSRKKFTVEVAQTMTSPNSLLPSH